MTISSNEATYDSQHNLLNCAGNWDLETLPHLQSMLETVSWPDHGHCIFNGAKIVKMDTAGAWLLSDWMKQLNTRGVQVQLQDFSKQKNELISLVSKRTEETLVKVAVKPPLGRIVLLGKTTVESFSEFTRYLSFIGKITLEGLRIAYTPWRWRWSALAATIFRTGFQALPIIALLSFMIGVVITYQMGLQLKNYGANIYIVDLLGLAILREFGPLLTAIMVAGRTGSAFTAQLGMMKLTQEIDALDTMGVTPTELLILPRIIGLLIALPLITMWSDIFGVLGGMIMSNNMLSITWYDFMQRFPKVIPLRALLIGLGKAPVFALVISSIGCYQGMQVEGGAESVGKNTTRSVVLSIFFIIVVDAIFSIILSKLKL